MIDRRSVMIQLFVIGFLLIQISFFGFVIALESSLTPQQRITESPQWSGERFQNKEQVPDVAWWPSVKMFWDYFSKPEGYLPAETLTSEPFNISLWREQRGFQFSWLGHTTFLIQIDGKAILTDPMFSQQAGSFGWISPKRYSETITTTEILPIIDIVLITHNHPDHLDENSIKALLPKANNFIVPLGVGGLLEEWGVPRQIITELDWWESKSLEDLTITAAPAKHTSERGIFDKNQTLWVSYGIRGKQQNLYLSGDSGWHAGLFEIGKRLGPFDVTFFEIGAYSNLKGQKEVHYTPEQAVKAHKAVKGKSLVPSGWGTFDLGLFPWYEPIERLSTAANQAGINYFTPKIGEIVVPEKDNGRDAWWRSLLKKVK